MRANPKSYPFLASVFPVRDASAIVAIDFVPSSTDSWLQQTRYADPRIKSNPLKTGKTGGNTGDRRDTPRKLGTDGKPGTCRDVPRSPNARDRGHPRPGLGASSRPRPPGRHQLLLRQALIAPWVACCPAERALPGLFAERSLPACRALPGLRPCGAVRRLSPTPRRAASFRLPPRRR